MRFVSIVENFMYSVFVHYSLFFVFLIVYVVESVLAVIAVKENLVSELKSIPYWYPDAVHKAIAIRIVFFLARFDYDYPFGSPHFLSGGFISIAIDVWIAYSCIRLIVRLRTSRRQSAQRSCSPDAPRH